MVFMVIKINPYFQTATQVPCLPYWDSLTRPKIWTSLLMCLKLSKIVLEANSVDLD